MLLDPTPSGDDSARHLKIKWPPKLAPQITIELIVNITNNALQVRTALNATVRDFLSALPKK
jgi:hypothetical protein